MTIEIKMPPELERQLNQAAEQAGATPDMYVVHLLQQALKQVHPNPLIRKPNLHSGAFVFSDDFDEPLPDSFWLGEA